MQSELTDSAARRNGTHERLALSFEAYQAKSDKQHSLVKLVDSLNSAKLDENVGKLSKSFIYPTPLKRV